VRRVKEEVDLLGLSTKRSTTASGTFALYNGSISPKGLCPLATGTERCYGAGGEDMATSSLHLIDGTGTRRRPSPRSSE
jgi:hypothetical protein